MDTRISWLASILILLTYMALGFITLGCLAGYLTSFSAMQSAVQEASLSASASTVVISGYVLARSIELGVRACERN